MFELEMCYNYCIYHLLLCIPNVMSIEINLISGFVGHGRFKLQMDSNFEFWNLWRGRLHVF